MFTRKIKKVLKKSSFLRKIGWWAEIHVISQLVKKKDEYEIRQEIRKRGKGIQPSLNDCTLQSLKDKHKGESCFVIGNGPSLRIEDLNKIYELGIPSFGLNKINNIYSRTLWRPTYLVVHDHRFLISGDSSIDIEDYVKKVQDDKTQWVFFRKQMKKCFDQSIAKKILYFRMPLKNCFQVDPTPIKGDISVQLEDLGTVTTAAIEIAMYMGFSTIYVYGQDFKYQKYIDIDGKYIDDGNVQEYIEGISYKDSKYKDDYHDLRKAFRGFKQCREYAESRGITILNATHGGNLDVFERIDIDEILMK